MAISTAFAEKNMYACCALSRKVDFPLKLQKLIHYPDTTPEDVIADTENMINQALRNLLVLLNTSCHQIEYALAIATLTGINMYSS